MYFSDGDILWALLIPALILVAIGAGIGWLLFA